MLLVGWAVAVVNVVLVWAVILGGLTRALGITNRLTLDHFREGLLVDHGAALGHTLLWSLTALPITATAALGLALVGRHGGRVGRLVGLLVGLFSTIPGVSLGVAGYAMALLLTPGSTAPLAVTAGAIVGVHVARGLPIVHELVAGELAGSPRLSDEAARMLHASPWRRWSMVLWPQLSRVCFAGLLAAFAQTVSAVASVVFLTSARVPLLGANALVELDGGRVGPACAIATTLGALVGLAALACRPLLERSPA